MTHLIVDSAAPERRGLVRRFFDANTRVSQRLAYRYSWQSDKPFWEQFHTLVIEAASTAPEGSTLVDLGGGRRCVWAHAVPKGVQLVAVDIDPDELAANPDVSDRRVGNVAQGLPLADGEAHLIVSRALLEHVDGVPAAIGHMARALEPGGRMLHFVPARNALYAIPARLGPFGLLKRLVHLAIPSAKNQVEFPVFYDHCTASDVEALCKRAGFSQVEVHVCYAQPGYFEPVLPAYLVVACYQWLVRRLGARQAAAYLIIDARL